MSCGTMAVFSAQKYDKQFITKTSEELGIEFEFKFLECLLEPKTAKLARGYDAVCVFVNDIVNEEVVEELSRGGVRLIALRCAGFNNVALERAEQLNITVARVPAYSPYAVAEHAVALMTSLNRRIPQAWAKTRQGNFSLVGQMGFDMFGKKVGVIGTGLIGSITSEILKCGFKCDVQAYDVYHNPKLEKPEPEGLGIKYVELDELFRTSDIISLHAPLLPSTHHIINAEAIEKMKPGVMIVNTSRGLLIDSEALVAGLKSKKIGYCGLDVYCKEGPYMFKDLRHVPIQDETLSRLLTFPNVIFTSHQAFFTVDAMNQISRTTLRNAHFVNKGFEPPKQGALETLVKPPPKK